MVSVCVLTLCGLPAAGKTTFATLFTDYLHQLDASSTKGSDVAEDQRPNSLRYRVIRVDYDSLIPPEVETSLSDDNEQFVVIITLGRFTVWISLSLRPKTDQTTQVRSQSGLEINQSSSARSITSLLTSSLISVFIYELATK